MQQYVLIVAGGKGERMKSAVPKQFIELQGKPMLMRTFEAFLNAAVHREFVIVLPGDYISEWKNLCQFHDFQIKHQIVESGPKRFHSVKSGLNLVPDNVLVAIHDAARPFVSKETIQRCFYTASRKGNAVPAVNFTESVREVSGALNKIVDRNHLKIIQTPQVFNSLQIKNAYKQNFRETFTDDANVLESAGFQINLVEGNPENIKITYPSDVEFAEFLLSGKNK